MLVDTHAHLNFPQFEEDRAAVLDRARRAGVLRVVNVGTNLGVSRASIELAGSVPGTAATGGFHPHDVGEASDEALSELRPLLCRSFVVAVGETGLDFYRDYAPRALQERVFAWHIAEAAARDLPLVVHSRGAEAQTLDMLEREGGGRVRGVLHCFGGTEEQAGRAVDLGFYVGFGGTVTFRNSAAAGVALSVRPDRLLLETDCPFLAPVPKRGKRNEPAFVRHVAAYLADRSGETLEALAARTSRNAERLFGLGPEPAQRNEPR